MLNQFQAYLVQRGYIASHWLSHVKALLKNGPINDVAFIFMAGICR